MKKFLFVLFAITFMLILLSCGTETENTPMPSFAIDRYAVAEKGYADITAPLPAGWDYSVITEEDDYGNEIFGIRFLPTEHPELSVRIGWQPGKTLPYNRSAGTKTKIDLPNNRILWRHTKRQGSDAQSISAAWDDYPYLYLADYILPDALEAEYEPIIREILCFTEFGGMRSVYEATAMVTARFDSYHAAGFSNLRAGTGAWCIYVEETENAIWRYFHVAADGEIREYFLEDQPMGGSEIVFRESEDPK